VTAKGNVFFENKQWLTETPKSIRQQAVFEAVKNFKSAFSNLRNKNIDKFKVRFKTLRRQRENGMMEQILSSVLVAILDVKSHMISNGLIH
jgi:hypothetical protein